MNNSLSMLLGAMEALAEQCGACPVADDYRHLQYQGPRITGQLVWLLGMCRMHHARYALYLEAHDVTDWPEALRLEHKALLGLKGIALALECDDALRRLFDGELVGGFRQA
jgi:hypothetical protein